MKITATLGSGADARTESVEKDLGKDLMDAVDKFGEPIVFSHYQAEMVLDVQSLIRRLIKAGKNAAEIQSYIDTWKPGIRSAREGGGASMKSLLQKLAGKTDAEILEMVRKAKADEAAAAAGKAPAAPAKKGAKV